MISHNFDNRKNEAISIQKEYRQIELRKKYGDLCDLKGHEKKQRPVEIVNEFQNNLKMMEQ